VPWEAYLDDFIFQEFEEENSLEIGRITNLRREIEFIRQMPKINLSCGEAVLEEQEDIIVTEEEEATASTATEDDCCCPICTRPYHQTKKVRSLEKNYSTLFTRFHFHRLSDYNMLSFS
jgi:hypothetical protein